MTRTSIAFEEPLSAGAAEFDPPPTGWGDVFRRAQALDVEGWNETIHTTWGRYKPVVNDPKAFVAKLQAQDLYGFSAMHLMPRAAHVERTQRDARLDGMDHYYAMFAVAGAVKVIQNDQAVELTSGQVVLVDSAKSVTYLADPKDQQPGAPGATTDWTNQRQCFVLQLPRQSLISHLGFEPQYRPGVRWNTRAGQALFQLVRDAVDDDGSMVGTPSSYMRLAIYDLIGGIFSSPDTAAFLRSDKLFRRVCDVVRNNFGDPDVSPDDVAAEVGISRRYLQKLFAMRNMTYTQYLNSVRLEHAARFLERRALLGTTQPISAIAYTCGFNNYANFARHFQKRFGYTPNAHAKCRPIRHGTSGTNG